MPFWTISDLMKVEWRDCPNKCRSHLYGDQCSKPPGHTGVHYGLGGDLAWHTEEEGWAKDDVDIDLDELVTCREKHYREPTDTEWPAHVAAVEDL